MKSQVCNQDIVGAILHKDMLIAINITGRLFYYRVKQPQLPPKHLMLFNDPHAWSNTKKSIAVYMSQTGIDLIDYAAHKIPLRLELQNCMAEFGKFVSGEQIVNKDNGNYIADIQV